MFVKWKARPLQKRFLDTLGKRRHESIRVTVYKTLCYSTGQMKQNQRE
jgi:hypothetical protein